MTEAAILEKNPTEIAGDITITWMQLMAQDPTTKSVATALSEERVSQFYSAVCKTVTQCHNFRASDPVRTKPENW